MSRYEDTRVIRTNTTDRKQSVKGKATTIYKQIPKRDSDVYVISQAGDRLDLLALQFYNDPNLWWYIAQANNLMAMNLEPNMSIRIPSDLSYSEPDLT
tara:strand:- start:2883 stop:3176 length:294 start_codon:yes stop_codon:yes gene_type:complete